MSRRSWLVGGWIYRWAGLRGINGDINHVNGLYWLSGKPRRGRTAKHDQPDATGTD